MRYPRVQIQEFPRHYQLLNLMNCRRYKKFTQGVGKVFYIQYRSYDLIYESCKKFKHYGMKIKKIPFTKMN